MVQKVELHHRRAVFSRLLFYCWSQQPAIGYKSLHSERMWAQPSLWNVNICMLCVPSARPPQLKEGLRKKAEGKLPVRFAEKLKCRGSDLAGGDFIHPVMIFFAVIYLEIRHVSFHYICGLDSSLTLFHLDCTVLFVSGFPI